MHERCSRATSGSPRSRGQRRSPPRHATPEGAFFLHDASDPDVPVGTATMGAEILEQLPEVDAIYVPMGDTALIRGVASAAKQQKPSIRIVGVVAANAPAYLLSWERAK